MLHIYRQVVALERFRPVVIARKRENPDRFPFDPVAIVSRPATHFARRFWFREVRQAPWQMSKGEVARVSRVLEATRADLMHVYFGHIAVHLLPLIRSWAGPSVVSFHGADVMVDMDKPAYRAATTAMLKAVRLVLVRSESLRRAVAALGCDDAKIRIHRTGIPLAEFAFRPRTWPTDGRWRFVQACRLVEKKGLATSIRAFAEFARSFPEAHFTISGEGPLQAELERLAAELGVQSKVAFTGFLPQPRLLDLYYASHVFLHPSETANDGNQEGVPNSMLEAMATGLAVFATAHGGIPDAISDGDDGVLVPERDHTALAVAIAHWTAETTALSQIAENGARAVAQKFEQREQARQLERYYSEALATR